MDREESLQIRNKLINGYRTDNNEYYCAKELAELATDTTIMGFEDSRSYAVEIIDRYKQAAIRPTIYRCGRYGCRISVEVDFRNDTYDIIDTFGDSGCKLDRTCTKLVWDESEGTKHVDVSDVSLTRATGEQIGFVCAKATCDFMCGYSNTSKGQFGACVNEQSQP